MIILIVSLGTVIVNNQDVTENEFTYTFNSYAKEYENCYFILSVDDGYGPVEVISDSFKMVWRTI